MKKLTLSVDVRMINNSGIGVYLKSILPFLVDEFEVTLLGNPHELKSLNWVKKCIVIEFKQPIYSISEQIAYLFKLPKSDIFWSPHFNSPLFLRRSKKMITTIHDVNHLANRKDFGLLKYFFAKILYQNAITKSDEIITVSTFSKREIERYLNSKNKKINVIYNAISPNFNSDFYSKLELPKKYILFVGNLKPHKNLITLLRAYNILNKEKRKEYSIVVVGKEKGFITSDNESLSFIKDNGLGNDVIFTGYLEDRQLPGIYSKASLLVFPSYYEGFGIPLLEAMISRVPVIASNLTSLPEIGRDAVCYFNPFSFEDLAEKIELLLSDNELRERYIKKGVHRCSEFSWVKVAESHKIIFNRVSNNVK